MLRMVTITGADDATSIQEMRQITDEFPFVEWGILIGSHDGQRFPSMKWVQALVEERGRAGARMNLSLHVCGKFGNRKPRVVLSEPFESMWIPVAVVCQCGGEMLLEFLGLFPSQNKTETCRCGWSVEVRFRMGE